MIEVAISSLLVGLLMVGALRSVGAVFRTWTIAAEQSTSHAFAQQLMTEVLQARYEDPEETPVFGHEPAEIQSPANRNDFDDVDDYHTWTASTPQEKDGTQLSDYVSWQRSITVELVDPNNPTVVVGTDQGLKRITVTITDPQSRQTMLVALRSRQGMLEQSPTADTTFVTWVGSALQIGVNGIPLYSGAQLENHSQDQ